MIEFSISDTHPSLNGHFPGNPMVPGVTLIEYIMAIVEEARPELIVTGVLRAKFLNTLKPNQMAQVMLELKDQGLHFHCQQGSTSIAAGLFKVTRNTPS